MTASIDVLADFQRLRPRLFGIAYRMLSDASEAEDLVQETYLRWHRANHALIENPEAWLVSVVTRLAIDRARSAEVERLQYVGPWLPEPIATDVPTTDFRAEQQSDLSIAFLALLERLGPEERAAFLLREVFDVEYEEIARIVEKSATATRQLVHRARERVRTPYARFEATPDARERLLGRFLAALEAGVQDALISLFDEEATFTSDSGGKVPAARRILGGPDRIARFLLGVQAKYRGLVEQRVQLVNGEPAMVTYVGQRVFAVTSIAGDGKRIHAVYRVMNPDKLQHMGAEVFAYPKRERKSSKRAGAAPPATEGIAR